MDMRIEDWILFLRREGHLPEELKSMPVDTILSSQENMSKVIACLCKFIYSAKINNINLDKLTEL